MPQIKVLVRERLAIYTDTSRAVPLENVAALDHELLDDPVEGRLEIASWLRTSQKFAGAHPPKIFCGFWRFVPKQLHLYSSTGNSSNGDIKKDDGVASGNSVEDDGVRHRDGHGFARGAAGGLQLRSDGVAGPQVL